MENPKCPYCGGKMELNTGTGHNIHGNKTVFFTYCCDVCEAESPPCDSKAEAYAAVMKREKKRKTYFEDFLQKHPKADMLHIIPLTGRDVPNLCRAIIYGETMNCPVLGCAACWNEVMEGEDE